MGLKDLQEEIFCLRIGGNLPYHEPIEILIVYAVRHRRQAVIDGIGIVVVRAINIAAGMSKFINESIRGTVD